MCRALLALSLLFILACEADPGVKKIPLGDPKLVKKGINLNFFPQVDILFVIDDSGSMNQFQKQLASNGDEFVDTIFKSRFIDFHIGVTTSNDNFEDTNGPIWFAPTWGGRLISNKGYNYVDRNTPDVKEILNSYLVPGVDGSVEEKFFSIARDALSEPILSKENIGFYRENAHLLIFFLTDAEDQSRNFGPLDFHKFLLDLKKGDENKIHFAAAIPPTGGNCDSSEDPAFMIEEFTRYVDGKNFNICSNDYGKDMVEIAHDIIERVSTVYLDEVPKVSTIKLSFGSQVIPHAIGIGWTYDPERNVIYLGRDLVLEEEPPGTNLEVDFEGLYK